MDNGNISVFKPENDSRYFQGVVALEQILEDVIELSDPFQLKFKLGEVETISKEKPGSVIDVLKNGIILHEGAARSLARGNRDETFDYAYQSQAALINLMTTFHPEEMQPIISAYMASSQMFMAISMQSFVELRKSLRTFQLSVSQYRDLSPLPEYLRAKAYLNLPWYFLFRKGKAKQDLSSILEKSHSKSRAVNSRIVSLSYLHMANLSKDDFQIRPQSIIDLLDKAIAWDHSYLAGREKAELLKTELIRKHRLKHTIVTPTPTPPQL